MRTLFVIAVVSSLVACKSPSPKPAEQPQDEPPPAEAEIKAPGPHVDGVPDDLTAAYEAQVTFLEQLADAMVAAGSDCAAMTQVMRDASNDGQPIFQALAEHPDLETHAETLIEYFVGRIEPADEKIGEASDVCQDDAAFMQAAAELGFE